MRNCSTACPPSASSRCSSGQGRELLRLSRTTILVAGGADFSRDMRFTETVQRGVNFAPADFRGSQPYMSISVSHSGFNAGVTVADIDLRFLSDFLGDAQVGKATFAYVVDSRGKVLASSAKGPDIGEDLSALPQVAALMTPNNAPLASGTRRRRPFGVDRGQRGAETRLVRVLRAADRAGAGADPGSAGADRAC